MAASQSGKSTTGTASGGTVLNSPCIIVHGGAWSIPKHFDVPYRKGVQEAVRAGYEVLKAAGSAVDAVESAVRSLEDDPNFNAGHGAILNEIGQVECDAMIMSGTTLDTGAVMAVKHFANPVSLARKVMEETSHCALNSEGALRFANKIGFPTLEDPSELLSEQAKKKCNFFREYNNAVKKHIGGKETELSHDTVGAVAMDCHGNIACATSTGGIPTKMVGRIGDSPLVGCGGYASEYGGCSTTGHGESLMKMTLAREVVYNIEQGCEAQVAAEKAVARMKSRVNGHGGVIVIDRHGNIGKDHSTQRMAWASIENNKLAYGLETNQFDVIEIE